MKGEKDPFFLSFFFLFPGGFLPMKTSDLILADGDIDTQGWIGGFGRFGGGSLAGKDLG